MEPEHKDESQVLETETTVEEKPQDTETIPEQEEDLETIRAKAAKADELEEKNKKLYARLKKKEEENAAATTDGLTNKDLLFLAKAEIHEDDIEDVTRYANLNKVTVSEAFNYLKPVLDVRSQERKTAQATNTKSVARGSSKISPEDILRKAESTGEVPETEEGLSALFQARLHKRLGIKK